MAWNPEADLTSSPQPVAPAQKTGWNPEADLTAGRDSTPQQPDTSNVVGRAKTYGYSALSPEDKATIDSSYGGSRYTAATLQQIHDQMDANAIHPNHGDRYGTGTGEAPLTRNESIINAIQHPLNTLGEVANDFRTGSPVDAIRSSYQAVRKVMAHTIAAPLLAPFDAIQSTVANPDGSNSVVEMYPGKNYLQRLAPAYLEQAKLGSRGEGLPGFISDPTNLLLAAPGVGEERIAGLLGRAGVGEDRAGRIAVSPWTQAGVSAASNMGISATTRYIDPLSSSTNSGIVLPSLKAAAVDAGVGYGSGLLGAVMRNSAIKNFPGDEAIEKLQMRGVKGTGMMDLSPAEREQVLQGVTKHSWYPLRKDYFKFGGQLTDLSGEDYQRVNKLFDVATARYGYPTGTVHADKMREAIKQSILDQAKSKGTLAHLVTGDMIDAFLDKKFAPIEFTAQINTTPDQVAATVNPKSRFVVAEEPAGGNKGLEFLRNIGKPKVTSRLEDAAAAKMGISPADAAQYMDEAAALAKHVPVSDIGRILGNLNVDIGGLLSKNPTADAKMAAVAHSSIYENILRNRELGMGSIGHIPLTEGQAQNEVQKALFNNLNVPLSELPVGPDGLLRASYTDFLKPKTIANYRVGSRLKQIVAKSPEGGQSMRIGMPLPIDGAVGEALPHAYLKVGSAYGTAGLKYRFGTALAERAFLANKIAAWALNHMTNPSDSAR